MAKLLVLSDSHRRRGYIERAAELFCAGGFFAAVHLGDVARDAELFCAMTGATSLCVRGNCDALSPAAPPRERTEKIGGMRLLLTHGDLYGVKSGLGRLGARAGELQCGLALFGHTHRPFAGALGGALLVNPGALADGRYAVVEIEGGRALPALCEF